ncbi:2-amino-4-hydroxy-6-hydroxymethyldihydropteridine diphosphokinase [Silanimonas sp.]|uniref:2-amino-4-hydroxy-6- hydroxymethyldihydropteridine diphosphokinase n=1 Tax=Silanimonas sp. TaxID=1929290 RepID=UPI001BBAEEB5|nr:2-amino-4-hydroxy-6-hydroxymethyldihydropteridine diphosphokinase [Silanimonas sp.]MBS3896275.1 2-amino-4-hydroxy-6-hydroxymethyldihydropteridine diphosphokinase [Silanimonas sp.]MBS3924249.1 2-amino-4-hydroxy-6-hydroxymethyldihydropteridine diphosphokinase [Xanthomonadaceae bacterium]
MSPGPGLAADGQPSRRAWVGLGGNLGDVAATFTAALRELEAGPELRLLQVSRLYRTPPWGLLAQPDFFNAVAAFDTRWPPLALLDRLHAIERVHGRDRARESRWGPRPLDLDLLAVEGEVLDSPRLQLPHPRIAERAFVLVPWTEIAPDLVLPGLGRIADLRDALDRSGIEAIP